MDISAFLGNLGWKGHFQPECLKTWAHKLFLEAGVNIFTAIISSLVQLHNSNAV